MTNGTPPNLPKLSEEQRATLLEAMTPPQRRKFLARECERLLGRVFAPAELAGEELHANGRALPGILKLASGRVYVTVHGTRFRTDPKLSKQERRQLRRLRKGEAA